MKSISDPPPMKTAIRALSIICIWIFVFSCSSDLETKFNSRVLSVQNYFSKKPVLISDIKLIKSNEDVYAYYGLMVISFKLSFDIQKYLLATPTANIIVSCEVLSNQEKGDLIDDSFNILGQTGGSYGVASGFSSITEAMNNKDFTRNVNDPIIFHIRYVYTGKEWIYRGLKILSGNRSIDSYLKQSEQYKDFRKAIGMIE